MTEDEIIEQKEDEGEYCHACAGTGEGQYDGSRCFVCKGRGFIAPIEDDEK